MRGGGDSFREGAGRGYGPWRARTQEERGLFVGTQDGGPGGLGKMSQSIGHAR